MSVEENFKDRLEIAMNIYNNLFNQINLAFTRASLILAYHGLSLGFLVKVSFDNLKEVKLRTLKLIASCFFLLTFLLAFISIFFAFRAFFPLLKDKTCRSECMFWIYHISCEGSERDLQRFKKNIKDYEMVIDCISSSIIALAEILKEKNENIKNSLYFLVVSLILEVLTIVILLFTSWPFPPTP